MSPELIKSAEFVKSAAGVQDLPQSLLPEIAFAGRSNSGKSTLINSLTKRRALAVASKTPGRTRLLNFFLLKLSDTPEYELHCHLVDLPGYGFAKVSGAKKKDWGKVLGDYLLGRPNLEILVLTHDIRRDLKQEEFWFFEQFGMQFTTGKTVFLALTKSDKLGANELRNRSKAINSQIQSFIMENGSGAQSREDSGAIDSCMFICGTDARGKRGVEQLRWEIFRRLLKS